MNHAHHPGRSPAQQADAAAGRCPAALCPRRRGWPPGCGLPARSWPSSRCRSRNQRIAASMSRCSSLIDRRVRLIDRRHFPEGIGWHGVLPVSDGRRFEIHVPETRKASRSCLRRPGLCFPDGWSRPPAARGRRRVLGIRSVDRVVTDALSHSGQWSAVGATLVRPKMSAVCPSAGPVRARETFAGLRRRTSAAPSGPAGSAMGGQEAAHCGAADPVDTVVVSAHNDGTP